MKSIRTKLMMAFLCIFILFIGFGLYQVLSIQAQLKNIERMEKQTLEIALNTDELKLSVVQVQQWLTDISATRGAKGYDDGFEEAEKYAKHALQIIGQLQELSADKQDKWQELKVIFQKYYDNGKIMASIYIQKGPEQGNAMMDEFDSSAELLNSKVDEFRKKSIDDIHQTVAEIRESIEAMVQNLIIVSIVILIVSFIISFLISRSISLPLLELLKGTKEIAEGNLQHCIQATSKDEVGKLAESFEYMRQNLYQLVTEIHQLSNQLHETTEHMAESTHQAGEASSQVAVTVNTMAAGTSKQSEHVSSILNMLKETNLQVERGNEQITQNVKNAEASTQFALEGEKSIQHAIEHLDEVTETVQFATDAIQKLGQRSNQIGGIITLITEISNQTNLLALNAAIESARAGEHGKGFAVVAEEVRKLAGQSHQAASQITGLIQDVQAETSVTVRTMESNLEAVKKQVDMIQNGGKALTMIVQKVQKTEEDADIIKDVFLSIQKNVEEVLHSIEQISHIMESSAAASQEVAASAEEQTATLEEIAASSTHLAHSAENLNQRVRSFQI